MFGDLLGRLLGGAAWGLGAGVVLSLTRDNGSTLRPVARALVQTYVAAADLVQHSAAEARERIEDLYAEVRAADKQRSGAGAESGRRSRTGTHRADGRDIEIGVQ